MGADTKTDKRKETEMNLLENMLPKLNLQNPPADPSERVH